MPRVPARNTPPNHDASTSAGDQALWLAACLAHETARDDRLLEDSYAARLAGLRGEDLFGGAPRPAAAFRAVLRMAAVDDLLQRVIIDQHVHTTITLGSGMDARPYRLSLPNDLRWVELDRDPLITYKELRLALAQPICRVERVAVDVTERKGRRAVLRRVAQGVARGLLVTENTAALSPTMLRELAIETPAGLRWWILDTGLSDQDALETLGSDRWRVAECWPLWDEARRRAPQRLRAYEALALERAHSDLGAVWLLRRPTRRGRR